MQCLYCRIPARKLGHTIPIQSLHGFRVFICVHHLLVIEYSSDFAVHFPEPLCNVVSLKSVYLSLLRRLSGRHIRLHACIVTKYGARHATT